MCNIRFYIAVWTWKRPCVECCLKQHGVSKQDAHDELTKLVESNSKWCNLIGQILYLFFKNYQLESHKPQDHWRLKTYIIVNLINVEPLGVPKNVLQVFLNFARVADVFYSDYDAFTESRTMAKDMLAALLINPMPIE